MNGAKITIIVTTPISASKYKYIILSTTYQTDMHTIKQKNKRNTRPHTTTLLTVNDPSLAVPYLWGNTSSIKMWLVVKTLTLTLTQALTELDPC